MLVNLSGLEKLRIIPEGLFDGCESLVEFPEFPNVEEIGDRAFRNSAIKNIGGMVKLKRIGEEAFSGCNQLTSMAGPSGLESIGKNAFRDCESLTETGSLASLKELGDYAFYGCKSLSEVGSLSSLTKLGEYAFYGCKSLTSFPELPLITRLERSTFEESGLTKLPYMPRLEIIGAQLFKNYGLEEFPDFPSLKEIGDEAFAGNNFREINIPWGVTVGEGAFADCKKLVKAELHALMVPYRCFRGCVNLEEFIHGPTLDFIDAQAFMDTKISKIPYSQYTSGIGGQAFYNVSTIESITVPSSVKQILRGAFTGMTGVKTIVIEPGPTLDFCELAQLRSLDSETKEQIKHPVMPLENVIINRTVNWLGNFPTSYYEFEGRDDYRLRTEGYSAFEIRLNIPQYPNLKEVRIEHDGGAYPPPFYNPETHIIFNCESMLRPPKIERHYKYRDEFTYEEDWSYYEYLEYLKNTKKVTFGPRMKKIWAECFGGLKDIYCQALTPPEFVESHFLNRIYLDATLHVPEEAIEAYMSTPGWREFYNIVPSSVDEIGNEAENVPARYFDLNGREVAGNLSPGIYIERRGSETRKVVIK